MPITATTHIVRRGETLTSIAKLYSTTVDSLAGDNGIQDKNNLAIGQSIMVPRSRTRSTVDAVIPKKEARLKPAQARQRELAEQVDSATVNGAQIIHDLLEGLLQRFRIQEANESTQKTEKAPLIKLQKPAPPVREPARKKGSVGSQGIGEVKQKLKEQLGKEPHVVTFSGVKLTENEKKQIMASVATCEMSKDGFGSINADQEFVGRKFNKKGIETSYSRIVHIGLSYGVIQFTQDGGELGNVLNKMQEKNERKFVEIFGGGDASIANNLIVLTTSGRPDLKDDSEVPLSGLSYWGKVRKKESGTELAKLANKDDDKNGKSDLPLSREIRGKRIRPISIDGIASATDLWTGTWKQRFLDAGQIVDFQEAQIEYAVSRYLQPVLKVAKENNVRSAMALAFMAACSVRGAQISLIIKVAKEKQIKLPFGSGDDERACVDAIANGSGKVGEVNFDPDESRRAKKLLLDDLGFLAEDLYDPATY